MINIIAATLLISGIGADVEKVYTVKNNSIQRYSAEAAIGLVIKVSNAADFGGKLNSKSLTRAIESINNINLLIDDKQEHGVLGVLKALHRISLYTFNRTDAGSVYYEYNIDYKNLSLTRSTRIKHKQIEFITSATGFEKSLMLKYASIKMDVNEIERDLVFNVYAYGDIGYFRCCLVNAIASRVAPKQIVTGLNTAINEAYIKIRDIRQLGSIDMLAYNFIDAIKSNTRVSTRRR